MDVGGSSGSGCQLWLFLGLLLDFSDLLPLLRRGRDLHSKDNITDFRLCQGSYVHTKKKRTTWGQEAIWLWENAESMHESKKKIMKKTQKLETVNIHLLVLFAIVS